MFAVYCIWISRQVLLLQRSRKGTFRAFINCYTGVTLPSHREMGGAPERQVYNYGYF
jgi:hypothetical protein